MFYVSGNVETKFMIFPSTETMNLSSLVGILSAPPTAELEPLKDGRLAQTDEQATVSTFFVKRELTTGEPKKSFLAKIPQNNILGNNDMAYD